MTRGNCLLVCFCALLLGAGHAALAQIPLVDESFELGYSEWVRYSLESPPDEESGLPIIGCVGAGCPFDVLYPSTVPDGINVCGTQSWGTTKNGGVYQTFTWEGGPAHIYLSARAYSIKYPEPGQPIEPLPDACFVRMGLLDFHASSYQDRSFVTQWEQFPWSEAWNVRKLLVPGSGYYTLFIESVQPLPTGVMSTLWDNVVWSELPAITVSAGPTAIIPGDSQHPDTTATIRWTTNVPSTSRVDYGLSPAYGQTVESGDLVTDHIVQLTGLTPQSTYHLRATSSAPDYASWTSDDTVFQTPIQFTDIATRISSDGQSTIISWRTSVPATTQVEYGFDQQYGQWTTEDPSTNFNHSVTLSGLVEDREYHYRVWSRNRPLFADAVSSDHVFNTLPTVSVSLRNPSFEESHGSQSPSLYPWVQYATFDGSGYHGIDGIIGPYPRGGPACWFAGFQAYDGDYFIGAAANSDYKNGGVLQRVQFPNNELCTLSAHFATHRQGGLEYYTRVRLGIDPDGGVNPESPTIKWWSGWSPTNDNQWHGAAVSARSGGNGFVTLFLEIRQEYPILWHVVAIDDAWFGAPQPMSIGALKNAASGLSAVLANKIVTHVELDWVPIGGTSYLKAYIQEDDRSAGVAVLFDTSRPDLPERGDRVTVTGSLAVRSSEATVTADEWTRIAANQAMPAPVLLNQRAVGGTALNQPGLYGSRGPCTVGLRVRVFGRVRWVYPEGLPANDLEVYLDDGSGLLDGSGVPGLRALLTGKPDKAVWTGDYLAATGVLLIRLIDDDGYPNEYDYYTYTLVTDEPEEWDVLHSGVP